MSDKKKSSDQPLLRLILLPAFILLLSTLGIWLYHFHGEFSEKHSVWGSFGDFFGGVLNPVFAFLALIALLRTIVLQSRQLEVSSNELSLTREEVSRSADALIGQEKHLQHQRFESAFFALLENFNNLRNTIKVGKPNDQNYLEGVSVFSSLCYEFRGWGLMEISSTTAYKDETEDNKRKILSSAYTEKYTDDKFLQIPEYFRVLYNLIKFVDRSLFLEDKDKYIAIIKAHLTRYELALIFYDSVSDFANEEVVSTFIKYDILEYFDVSTIPEWTVFMFHELVKRN